MLWWNLIIISRHLCRKYLISHFTTSFLLMETGSAIRDMAMCGCPMRELISDLIPVMETGYIPMPDGPGLLTITGDGHLFTMAAGFLKMAMAGCGFPVTN